MNKDSEFISIDEENRFKALDEQFNNLPYVVDILKKQEELYNILMSQLPPKLKRLLKKCKTKCKIFQDATTRFYYRNGYLDLYNFIKMNQPVKNDTDQ